MTMTDKRPDPATGLEFDPFAPAFLADPYPWFARYREEHPVFYAPELDYWVISRYHDVRTALRDSTNYSAANSLIPVQPPCPRASATLRDGGFRSVPALTNADPPAHTRVRRIANAGFTPRLVAGYEGFIRDLTARLIEQRLRGGYADIVRELTWELPALVILRLLGVPEDDVLRVKAWAGNRLLFLFGRQDEEQQVAVAERMASFWRYTEHLAAGRRERPGDDYTSALVHALDADGLPLTEQEAATVLFGLLLAGHETTTNLLTNGLRRLLEQRAAWEQLCAAPALIPNAVEEILRYDPATTIWRRRTKVATEVQGVEIPAEGNLLLLLAAANRDPAVFDEPNRFDIRRWNAGDHLSFGSGNHFCLGAPLARLEARVVFEELTRRLPSLRLVPDQPLSFHPNIAFCGPRSLEVEWDERRS